MATRIGSALRVARDEAGSSQRELGEKVKMRQAQIAQFERGERPPSLREFVRLVAVYPQLLSVAFMPGSKKAS